MCVIDGKRILPPARRGFIPRQGEVTMAAKTICKHCGLGRVPWHELKIRFGQLIHKDGMTVEEAKAVMPACSWCAAAIRKKRKVGADV
jgi:hypothetical protein